MPACPSCGIDVPESFDSCDNCGHSLVDDAPGDGPSAPRLPAMAVLRWSGRNLLTTPALVAVGILGGVMGLFAARVTGPATGWVLTTTAALYPAAVANRYVAAWAADESGGVAEFVAALRRLPAMVGVYLGILVVLWVTLFLAVLVFRPAFGLVLWLFVLVYLLLRFVLAFPAAVIAERGPGSALSESWAVSDGARATILGIVVVLAVAGLPFEVLEGRATVLRVATAGASGLLTTLASAAFGRVFLQQTL